MSCAEGLVKLAVTGGVFLSLLVIVRQVLELQRKSIALENRRERDNIKWKDENRLDIIKGALILYEMARIVSQEKLIE